MKPPFEQEYKKIDRALFLVALGYLHNTEGARDAVGEAVLSALESYGKLRQPEFFKTWMTRIVINKCLDMLRRRARECQLIDGAGVLENQPQENLELLDAVCRLDNELAPCITLRFYCGMTYEEASQAMGVPVSTAKYRTQKALNALKAMLEVSIDD